MYLTGIFFTIFSSLAFAVTYAFYKLSLPMISGTALLCVQNFLALLCLIPFILREGVSRTLVTDQLGSIFLRSLFGLGSVYFIILALQTTNLAEVTLLNNIAPLCVPFIASIWLKEKINHKLWPSLFLGFVGIALILQPWAEASFSRGLVYALISGIFAGCLVIATKQISNQPFLRLLFYRFLFFALITFPFALGSWKVVPAFVWIYVFAAALMLLVSQWSFTAALRHAPSQVIAPFFYTLVVFSMILDWFLWKKTPSWLTFLGMCVVATGCVITILLTRKKPSGDAFLIVEPVSSGSFYKLVAQEKGYRVIGVFQFLDAFYEKRFHLSEKIRSQNCDLVIHSGDVDSILKQLKATTFNVKGCVAGSEAGVDLTEKLCVALGLFSNPVGTAQALRDKGIMRQVLKNSGLSCPDFAVCASLEMLEEFVQNHTFPLVVKTPKGAGTSQVFVCDNREQLLKSFQEIMEQHNPYGDRAGYAVVEEYIEGKEYVIDTFSDGSQMHITDAWFYDKISTELFKNVYYNVISVPLNDPSIQLIKSYAFQVLKAYQIKRGPAHIEIKDDPIRGPTLIEIAGRLAGAGMARMVWENSNFNPFQASLEVFTKGITSCPSPIVLYKHLALCLCPVFQSGTVKKIVGLEDILKLPSYVRHNLSLHIGEKIEPSTDLGSIPLSVQLAHTDRHQLLKDVEKMHELFRVEVEL